MRSAITMGKISVWWPRNLTLSSACSPRPARTLPSGLVSKPISLGSAAIEPDPAFGGQVSQNRCQGRNRTAPGARHRARPAPRLRAGRHLTATGALRAEATLDERGYLAAAGGRTGLASARVGDAEIAEPFAPPEIVEPPAVAVAGAVGGTGLRLRTTTSARRRRRCPTSVRSTSSSVPGDAWDVAVAPRRRRGPA